MPSNAEAEPIPPVVLDTAMLRPSRFTTPGTAVIPPSDSRRMSPYAPLPARATMRLTSSDESLVIATPPAPAVAVSRAFGPSATCSGAAAVPMAELTAESVRSRDSMEVAADVVRTPSVWIRVVPCGLTISPRNVTPLREEMSTRPAVASNVTANG